MTENKYKAKYIYSTAGAILMNPGDTILMDGDKVYNSTRGLDFTIGDPLEFRDMYLQSIDYTNINSVPLHWTPNVANTTKVSNITKMEVLLDKMLQTYEKKNHDYGNSFEQSLDEEGIAASRIRIGDKWNRFKQLSKGKDALVDNESIRDTLLDMANYAIMTVMWLDKDEGEKGT